MERRAPSPRRDQHIWRGRAVHLAVELAALSAIDFVGKRIEKPPTPMKEYSVTATHMDIWQSRFNHYAQVG